MFRAVFNHSSNMLLGTASFLSISPIARALRSSLGSYRNNLLYIFILYYFRSKSNRNENWIIGNSFCAYSLESVVSSPTIWHFMWLEFFDGLFFVLYLFSVERENLLYYGYFSKNGNYIKNWLCLNFYIYSPLGSPPWFWFQIFANCGCKLLLPHMHRSFW